MTPLAERLSELRVAPIETDYVPLTRTEVAELERRLGAPLPSDYVEFALTYGLCFLQDWGVVPLLGDARSVPLSTFFGGQASEPSVLAMQEEYADAFPKGVVPIAEEPGGNLYLLWVSDPELPGSIWYADYSSADRTALRGDGTWEVPCYVAARSFTDLLNRTQASEEP